VCPYDPKRERIFELNKANGTGSIDRSARVRRIKRVLIGLLIAVIILPTVLCFFLLAKINKMEKQIYELSLKKETYTVVQGDTFVTEPKASEPEAHELSANTLIKTEYEDELDETESEELLLEEETSSVSPEEGMLEEDTGNEADIPDSIQNFLNTEAAKTVYLTFDDGPSNNTEEILAILKRYGVKATFFVNGKEDESLQPLYKKIVDEGHVIGMHSYTHVYKEVYASQEAFTYDLNRIQSFIYEKTGKLPTIYRFPGGSGNTVSNLPVTQFEDILSNRGIVYYDWNVVSGDASSRYGLPADVIANRVLSGVAANQESIVLMHDLPEKDTTVEALSTIIEGIQAMGGQIVPIDENTPQIHQTETDY